jgi:two-component system cell cycle response regulator CtrA
MPDYDARMQVLEAENTALRDRVAFLEQEIGLANAENAGLYFDLTPREAICFGVLLNNKAPRRSTFMAALYSDRADDEIEPKIIDVFICKIRKKMRPLGIEIKTHWGEAYEMPVESKAKARELMAEENHEIAAS